MRVLVVLVAELMIVGVAEIVVDGVGVIRVVAEVVVVVGRRERGGGISLSLIHI